MFLLMSLLCFIAAMEVPVYEKLPPKYRAHDILQILLSPQIELERIATVKPIQVTNHGLNDCAICLRR